MQLNFTIKNLGKRNIKSPLKISNFTSDDQRLLFNAYIDSYLSVTDANGLPLSVELAGPRDWIFFDPKKTKAAIVTCGGLCPGINNVIRSITNTLFF